VRPALRLAPAARGRCLCCAALPCPCLACTIKSNERYAQKLSLLAAVAGWLDDAGHGITGLGGGLLDLGPASSLYCFHRLPSQRVVCHSRLLSGILCACPSSLWSISKGTTLWQLVT
jgi:hypothetical protein